MDSALNGFDSTACSKRRGFIACRVLPRGSRCSRPRLRSLGEQPTPLDDDFMGHRGLYDFSFAGTAVLLSFQAYLARPSDLAVVWRRAGHDRFVLLDDDRRRALALSCTGAMFEARITALP